ncbi:MAG: hypothetical protein C4322_15895, partial [Mastigocladus sp. ERB_26_1]
MNPKNPCSSPHKRGEIFVHEDLTRIASKHWRSQFLGDGHQMLETWSQSLNFSKIGEKFGTPIYIFYPSQLEKNFSDYLQFVEQPRNIAYPVKANPSLAVLRQVLQLNGSVDCASKSEVNLAMFAGFVAERIIFNSPAADSH